MAVIVQSGITKKDGLYKTALFPVRRDNQERRMWWRYKTNKAKYEKTRMWLKVGSNELPPPQVYEQVSQFVREVVKLSPRLYGKGAYGLVVAAVWQEKDRSDRWYIDFLYSRVDSQ